MTSYDNTIQNKPYTLPNGIVNFSVSACTETIVDDVFYMISFYNKRNHTFCGYLNQDYYSLTKDINGSIKCNRSGYLEDILTDFLDKTFLHKNHYRIIVNYFRDSDEEGRKYGKIYEKYFNGLEKKDIEAKIIEYDLELRKIKINKIKNKLHG
jgi:hypothetical protein